MWNTPAYYSQTYYPSYDAYREVPRRASQSPPPSVTFFFSPAPSFCISQPTCAQVIMAPPMTWIERGPDGRPYFVRKKSKLPSARELLADALAPLRKSSSPFSRAYRRNHHIVLAPWTIPLYLPAPPLPPANFATPLPLPNNLPPSGTNTMTMDPTQYADHTRSGRESNGDNLRGILKPQPQHYPVPHPTMYPAPPPNVPPMQHPGFGTLPHQIPGQIQHIPTQPLGAYPSQPLPPGARIISPPRYPTADELKYKCSICGRFRSARYHYQHPLPPGQLPGKTICRKCREQATHSEDSVSTDSEENHKTRHRHGHSRNRAGSTATKQRRAMSRRGRSIGREDWSDDGYEDDIRDMRRSYSRSSSLEYLPLRSRSQRRRSQRPQSPVVEIVRYVERPPRPQLTRRIVYVENERPRRDEEYEWEEEEDCYRYRPPHRTRRISRPPTPAPRVTRSRVSDPALRTPLGIEQHDHFRERGSSRDDHPPLVRPPSRAASRSRVASTPYRWGNEPTSASNDSFYDDHGRSSYRRPRSLMGRGPSRSRSRPDRRVHVRELPRSTSNIPHAPSPPDWREEDHTELEDTRGRHFFNDGAEQARPRPSTGGRSQSRAPSTTPSYRPSEILRPGDEVTVIERHGSGSSEDYDWYDRDGMRVRVREI